MNWRGGDRPPRIWEIPVGTDAAKCRGCGAEIYWIKTSKGKNMPVDPDGISHFQTCPERDKFSRSGTGSAGAIGALTKRVKELEEKVDWIVEKLSEAR